ncbi:MAG TPA: YciI family protein [Pseudacidobacterium sp.]|nr:YciI family protein [Pseudacidobacterium sp.]
MPQYMILLRNDGDPFSRLSPEEAQRTTEKYFAWRQKPFTVGGARLDHQGRVIRKQNGSVSVSDGPFSEGREVLGGYYAIEAANFDEAVKFALTNPHIDFGTIEVREVVPRPADK